jgi:hypothetical protein
MGSNLTRDFNASRVYSLFVLSYVNNGFVTGWSPVQGVLSAIFKIHSSRLILMGNRPWSPIRQSRRGRIIWTTKPLTHLYSPLLLSAFISYLFCQFLEFYLNINGCINLLEFSACKNTHFSQLRLFRKTIKRVKGYMLGDFNSASSDLYILTWKWSVIGSFLVNAWYIHIKGSNKYNMWVIAECINI